MLLINSVCHAQVELRFRPEISDKAAMLGDVLIITGENWTKLPLESHPTSGETITKTKIIDWMTQRLGHFDYAWQGKTQIQVKQSTHTSGKLLVEKAKAALIEQLKTQYLRVVVTPLSQLKDSEYLPDDFTVDVDVNFPTSKRVCVWLTHEKSKIAVWFKINAWANVLVTNRDMHYNTPIQTDAFSMKERNIAGLNAAPVQTLPQQAWLKSSIERGDILLENQIKQPPLVVHGQHVKVTTHNHSITIVIDAIALADGYLGEDITVKNSLNHKTFVARISGFQQAEITL